MTLIDRLPLLLVACLGLCLAACGGRARLSADSGRSVAQVWNAQLNSQPAQTLATMSADDAKVALARHYGGNAGTGGAAGASTRRMGGGRGGMLTPTTTDVSDGAPNGRKISLQ